MSVTTLPKTLIFVVMDLRCEKVTLTLMSIIKSMVKYIFKNVFIMKHMRSKVDRKDKIRKLIELNKAESKYFCVGKHNVLKTYFNISFDS